MSEQTKTYNIALYLYEDNDTPQIMKTDSWVVTTGSSDYIRCSEPMEVSFKLLSHQDTTLAQVASLKRQQVRNMASFNAEQTELEGRINDLLALPDLSARGKS